MTTKNMIETTADGSIILPTYAHASGGWKFTDDENGITIFQSENRTFGMRFAIFMGWSEPHPHAEFTPSRRSTFTEAENLYDTVDAVDEFRAWLKDCADAFAWVQTVDAERGIEALTSQEALRRDTPEIPTENNENTIPFLWADGGMECYVDGAETVYELSGGVGVDDLNTCAVATRRYHAHDGKLLSREETLHVNLPEELPASGAYRVAAAIALAAAGMEFNKATARPETVDSFAMFLRADASETIN